MCRTFGWFCLLDVALTITGKQREVPDHKDRCLSTRRRQQDAQHFVLCGWTWRRRGAGVSPVHQMRDGAPLHVWSGRTLSGERSSLGKVRAAERGTGGVKNCIAMASCATSLTRSHLLENRNTEPEKAAGGDRQLVGRVYSGLEPDRGSWLVVWCGD